MAKKVQLWLTLCILLLANSWLATKITIENTDIDGFFPTQTQTLGNFDLIDYRFIFINSEESKLESLASQEQIEYFLKVPQKLASKETIKQADKTLTYLVFFKPKNQTALLTNFSSQEYMGTPVVGAMLSAEFFEQTLLYLWILLFLIVPFIIWVSSYRYLLTLSQELLVFSSMVLTVIWLFSINLTPAYLLSLLFIYLYAFTNINQLHFNEMKTKPLAFSMAISILTTFLSGFLLSFSNFGIISEFGFSLMLWLVILSTFIALQLILKNRQKLDLTWFKATAIDIKRKTLLTILTILFLLSTLPFLGQSSIQTQFNSLLQSSYKTQIEKFESEHVFAQPVLLAITANDCNLTEHQCNLDLHQLENKIQQDFPLKTNEVSNLNTLYKEFNEQAFSQSSSASFAQFKFALEITGNDHFLYSSDYKTAYQMFSLSLLNPIEELAKAKLYIDEINRDQKRFEVQLLGRFNDVAFYKQIFYDEMWQGIAIIMLVLVAGVTFLYRNVMANISLLPALLTMGIFTFIHWLTNSPFTIMSLVAVILFVGLIADNIIHILMAYRTHYESCFKIAFKPILLSNVILITSLSLVFFIDTGFLRVFGLELALLLILHLVFIKFLLPSLFKIMLPRKPEVNSTK